LSGGCEWGMLEREEKIERKGGRGLPVLSFPGLGTVATKSWVVGGAEE
jgi:hypothetical protein